MPGALARPALPTLSRSTLVLEEHEVHLARVHAVVLLVTLGGLSTYAPPRLPRSTAVSERGPWRKRTSRVSIGPFGRLQKACPNDLGALAPELQPFEGTKRT